MYCIFKWPPWSLSYGSWIYNYLCNRCLSTLKLWIRMPLISRCTRYNIWTLCDKVCQWLAAGLWFSPGTTVSSTNKTDRHDITEIMLKVALSTIILTRFGFSWLVRFELCAHLQCYPKFSAEELLMVYCSAKYTINPYVM